MVNIILLITYSYRDYKILVNLTYIITLMGSGIQLKYVK